MFIPRGIQVNARVSDLDTTRSPVDLFNTMRLLACVDALGLAIVKYSLIVLAHLKVHPIWVGKRASPYPV